MALSMTNFYPLSSLAPKSPNFTLKIEYFFLVHTQVEPSYWFLRWMAQTTCFHTRTVLLGVWTMSDVIWGKYAPKTPQKGAWIGSFKPKSIHCNISGTINPTNMRFEDRVQTTKCASWVVCYYPKSNTKWLTAAILKIDMTS